MSVYTYTSGSEVESDYGPDLTVSDEERLVAVCDRLYPPERPRPRPPASAPFRANPTPRSAPPEPTPERSTTSPLSPASRKHGSGNYAQPPRSPAHQQDAQVYPPRHFNHAAASQAIDATIRASDEDGLNFDLSELNDDDSSPRLLPKNGINRKKRHSPPAPAAPPAQHRKVNSFFAETKAAASYAPPPPLFPDKAVRYPDLSHALSAVQPGAEVANEEGDAEASEKDTRSPIERFRTAPKRSLTVTDLTAGSWCELQYYYTLSRLGGRRTNTAAMKGGTAVHEKLERELYVPVAIKTDKKEDTFGLKIWNLITELRSLRESGLAREVQVWGMVDGNVVSGVIDSLSYENPDPELEEDVLSSRGSSQSSQRIADLLPAGSPGKLEIFITDVKTRTSPNPPPKPQVHVAIIQLFLYHRFLSEMASDKLDYLRVIRRYGMDPDEPFSDVFMAEIPELHDEVLPDAYADSEATLSDDGMSENSYTTAKSRNTAGGSLLRYYSLRSLLNLLEFEVRRTFPHGASDIGQIVAVEYRYRSKNPVFQEDSSEHDEEGDDERMREGRVISVNTFFVEPDTLDLYLQETLGWWKGERAPRGVHPDEAYKCRSCEFAESCGWRMNLELEHHRKIKAGKKVESSSRAKTPAKERKGGAGKKKGAREEEYAW